MTGDLVAYNIIPMDTTSVSNVVALPEVRAAVSALRYSRCLPTLPGDFPIPSARASDMLDFLQYVFGFQKENVANQREQVVHLLAKEQSCLKIPDELEPKLDETAVDEVFSKSLENYGKWCKKLGICPVWNHLDSVSKEKKLLLISLHFLIWGEAANVRFLPQCLCYIFHHMAREMDEILRQQLAEPASSCKIDDDGSFLERVIFPIDEVVSAEARSSKGLAPHSSWRNYDDLNEYFLSLNCFDLSWPWRKASPFFAKQKIKTKVTVFQRMIHICTRGG